MEFPSFKPLRLRDYGVDMCPYIWISSDFSWVMAGYILCTLAMRVKVGQFVDFERKESWLIIIRNKK